MIVVKSIIGWGAPNKQDTASAHGEALGEDEVKAAKKFYGWLYGWPEDKQFYVPDGVMQHFADGFGACGKKLYAGWVERFKAYEKSNPARAKEAWEMLETKLPDGWESAIPTFEADEKGLATRDSSSKVVNALAHRIPWLIGGAADLSPSTKTNLKFDGAGSFGADDYAGRNLHFGIREHGMGSVANGLALSDMMCAYASTLLIFSDYMKPPIRLSAIMEVPVIYVFTHDSIGVGEDGPTHQPIEQLAALRAVSGLMLLRSADANEVGEACRVALSHNKEPSCIVLTCQPLPTFDRKKYASAEGTRRVRARRCRRRQETRSHPDGDRQRSAAVHRGLRKAQERRHRGACGVDAVLGYLRKAGRHVQGIRAARRRACARFRRAGRDARLGPLHGSPGFADRHAYVRRVRAAQGAQNQVRLHAGKGL